jgi:hypothetical protein
VDVTTAPCGESFFASWPALWLCPRAGEETPCGVDSVVGDSDGDGGRTVASIASGGPMRAWDGTRTGTLWLKD